MTWKLLTALFLAALAATLLSADGVQDRTPEIGGRDRRLASDKATAARRQAQDIDTLREMQGGWQLIELRVPDLPDLGRQDVGYMVVASEFASIEVHTARFDDDGEEQDSFIQTGIYRLNFDIYGQLLATLLIGSVDGGLELTVPREPGAVSAYEARVVGDVLTLATDDGARLTFERVASGRLTHLLYEDTEWLPRATEAAVSEVESSKAGEGG